MRFIISFLAVLCLVPVGAKAQATTNGPTRQMSLADCLRSALERNLSIQVGDRVDLGGATADLDQRSGGRLGLEASRISLHQAYGYYDPEFSARIGQNFNTVPGGFNDLTGAPVPSRETWRESFSAGLGGRLPTGARYDLTATGSRVSGVDFSRTNPITGKPEGIPFEYSGDTQITISQPLLRNFWIDGGRLNIKLSKSDIKLSELGVQLLVMDIVKRVALSYFDLVAARDQIKVQVKALELARQLVAENRKKVEVGTMAPLDEKQAESQAAKSESDLTSAIFVAQQNENLLKALITHDFAEIQPVTLEPTDKLLALYQSFSLPECWRNGLEKRPDYLRNKQVVEDQNLILTYRRNQLFPELDLAGTYGRNALGTTSEGYSDSMNENRFPKYGGTLTLSFPLTFRADRDQLKKAKLAKESAILTLKRKEDSVLQEIDDALKKVISAYLTAVSRKSARVYAEAALDAEQKKLDNGKSTSFNVLQLQKDLTAASSDEIKALADYNKALHELYFSEGTTLERNKVTLELR